MTLEEVRKEMQNLEQIRDTMDPAGYEETKRMYEEMEQRLLAAPAAAPQPEATVPPSPVVTPPPPMPTVPVAEMVPSISTAPVETVQTVSFAEPVKPAPNPATAIKTGFTVVLKTFNDNRKIAIVKAVMEATSLGLSEAKKLIESVPTPIRENISKEGADKIKEILTTAGGTVEIS